MTQNEESNGITQDPLDDQLFRKSNNVYKLTLEYIYDQIELII